MRYFGLTVVFCCIACLGFASSKEQDSVANRPLVINSINIIGNKTTKSRIILREVTFSTGDTLTEPELIEAMGISSNNLRNTSLFNFVTINHLLLDSTHVQVVISVTERWYTWPFPIFSLAETNFNTWWENREFNRINYGMDITRYNFRGRNEKLRLKLQLGFTEKIALQYRVPNLNKKQTAGFNVGFGYSRNHEVNYLSEGNQRLFYKDKDRYIRESYDGGVAFSLRRKFFETNSIGLHYNQLHLADTVLELNRNYLPNGQTTSRFLSLGYAYVLDRRNNKNYPLTGYYLSLGVTKTGLGLFDSNVDLLDLHLGARKFWQLGNRFYLAGSVNTWQALNSNQPYALQGGLGYRDKATVRSYEFYVIDGQQMGVAKSQLRYELVAPTTVNLPYVMVNKFKKFHYSIYLGIFTDVGYARDRGVIPNNPLANDWQYGSGVSIDWVTYYDIVFRTEYSVNKFGEHGLFLHFVSPI
jgi:outer membrane protein assembly factor BamA